MEASTASAAGSRRRNWPAILGPLLSAAGVVGYFIVVFSTSAELAAVRDWALPNWALIAGGLTLSLIGLRRGSGRIMPRLLAVTSVGLAAFLAWILYVMPALPPATGPTIGAAAPDFALTAPDGRTMRLADFRGKPLLLVFYRGHW
jgi:hypothetical protein